MVITKQILADRIVQYLRQSITLPQLVDWAEETLMDAEFSEEDTPLLADVVARLGVADVRAFGLTWEECEELLSRLGFKARIDVVAS